MARDLQVVVQQMRHWAAEAGQMAAAYEAEQLHVRVKSGKADFATEADLAVERQLVNAIGAQFPDDGIVTEELLSSVGRSPYQWIIDPIDGTTNFIKGIPMYCVAMALVHNGQPVAAVIYDIPRQRCMWAVRDGGTYIEEQRVYVAQRFPLNIATVATELSGRRQACENPARHDQAPELFGHVRALGSTCLGFAFTACGFTDLCFYRGANAWDAAAGILLVQEAGGLVTTWSGEPYMIGESQSIVAGNPRLVKAFAELVSSLDSGKQ